jgi:hypothetical protein
MVAGGEAQRDILVLASPGHYRMFRRNNGEAKSQRVRVIKGERHGVENIGMQSSFSAVGAASL